MSPEATIKVYDLPIFWENKNVFKGGGSGVLARPPSGSAIVVNVVGWLHCGLTAQWTDCTVDWLPSELTYCSVDWLPSELTAQWTDCTVNWLHNKLTAVDWLHCGLSTGDWLHSAPTAVVGHHGEETAPHWSSGRTSCALRRPHYTGAVVGHHARWGDRTTPGWRPSRLMANWNDNVW